MKSRRTDEVIVEGRPRLDARDEDREHLEDVVAEMLVGALERERAEERPA